MATQGHKLQEICSVLLDAYPAVVELRMMVRFELSLELEQIAGGESLRVIIFNLLTWADRTGRVEYLIEGAYRNNPGNAALNALVQAWHGGAPQTVSTQSGAHTRIAAPSKPVTIDLFLSYSREDIEAMRIVRDTLHEAGIAVWCGEGIPPGEQSWRIVIQEALTQARAMVVLLSPAANHSQRVNNEILFAQKLGKHIFSVLMKGDMTTSVPLSLMSVQLIDGRQDLLRTIINELCPAALASLRRV
jgi:hypothetical protein